MRNPLKRVRGAKITGVDLLKKSDLFSDLLEAIKYLNPTASDEQVLFMGTTTLLAITNTTALSNAVKVATDEAINKAKEVSVLTDMFNAPTSNTNN
jgi:predicted hydrolase (HD superfamily)